MSDYGFDPNLDLKIERVIDVPRELVWKAWTDPEHIKHWFAPRPWTIVDCDVDLRPAGGIRFTMRSPEGQDYPNMGCYLEVVENERLAWTDALLPGFRPSEKPFFTAIILLENQGDKTKYTAIALHKNETDRKTHEDMGFDAGWNQCLDQLVEHMSQFKERATEQS